MPPNSGCPPRASAYLTPPGPRRFAASDQAACSSRAVASGAASSARAADVSVVARVDLWPGTSDGVALGLAAKADDSAARESDATGPVGSWMGLCWAAGSEVC